VENPSAYLQDDIFQQNQGLLASNNGQFHSVYRVVPNSNGSVLQQVPLYDIFPAWLTRTTSRKFIENAMFELLMFLGVCDSRYLQYGDLLVDNKSGESYVYGNRRIQTAAVLVRVETLVTIGQSYNPGSARPATPRGPGGHVISGYATARNDITQPITLVNGAYNVGAVGDVPAQLLVGVQMKNQIGGPHDAELPNSELRSNFVVYVPPLGGANGEPAPAIRENMVIAVVGSDTKYTVLSCITSMQGFVGTVCIVQKVGV
jgi:hypothetical protein